MRTTLTIDEDVAIRLTELQKNKGVTLKEAVNSLLRKGLLVEEKPQKLKPFKVKARSLGKVREGFNLDKISEVLETLDELEGRNDSFRR